MHFILAALLGASAAAAVASSANAQGASNEERARVRAVTTQSPTWDNWPAWLGFSWISDFEDYGGGVWIYDAPARDALPAGRPTRPRYVAMQASTRIDEPEQRAWTNSDQCPALMDIVRSYERLEPPRIRVSGLHWSPTLSKRRLHGTWWTIWARQTGQPDEFPSDITMTSNAGMIEEWGSSARAMLADCWTPQEPASDF